MKKILSALFFAVLFCLLTACAFFNVNGDSVSSSSSSDSAYQDSVEAHKHTLVKMVAQASTCTKEGNVEFFFLLGL